MIALCSAAIDWSATGTWVTGGITAIVAVSALRTWKKQIKLQDRYSKIDALLKSFFNYLIAAHDWQLSAGSGEKRDILRESDESLLRKTALMQYRMDWALIKFYLDDKSDELWFSPSKLDNKVIQIGTNLHQSNFIVFEKDMIAILEDGIRDISNLKR